VSRVEILVEGVLGLVIARARVVPLVAPGHFASPETVIGRRHCELRFVGDDGADDRCTHNVGVRVVSRSWQLPILAQLEIFFVQPFAQ